MAQHLCIVARDNPLLLGYLNIALDYLSRGGDELEIVIDRRPDPAALESLNGAAPMPAIEQRQIQGVEELLRARGYAIVTREAGRAWRLASESDAPARAASDETAPRASLIELGSTAQRRALLAAAALAVVVLGASVGMPGDLLDRAFDAAGQTVSWLHGTSERSSGPASPPREPVPPAGAQAPAAAPAPPPRVVTPPPAAPAAVAAPPPTTTSPPAVAAPPAPAPAPPSPKARETAAAPAPARPRGAAREPAPASREHASSAEPRRAAKAPREDAPAPKAAVAAVSVQKTPEFRGMPRMELSRERDGAGHTVAVTVRLTDTGGRPLPAADVRVRRRLASGDVRETRLAEGATEGSYRGPLPAPVPEAEGLTMRVTLGDESHEVPLAE
jgi:hypothetical protein